MMQILVGAELGGGAGQTEWYNSQRTPKSMGRVMQVM